MIRGKLGEIYKQKGISLNLDRAIEYIENSFNTDMKDGHYVVEENNILVNVFSYDTMLSEEAVFEGHKKYIDIHILLSGQESIEIADESMLTQQSDYNESEDFATYRGKATTVCQVDNSDYVITFMEDIHKPKVQIGQPSRVKKVVIKVKNDICEREVCLDE